MIQFNKTSIKIIQLLSIWILFILISPNQSISAPHPGTGTSLINNPELGAFLLPLGFRVSTAGVDWIPKSTSKTHIFESYRLGPKDPQNVDSFLSVRIDRLDKKASLELYAKKWLRDYPQLGFELYGTRPFKLNGNSGLVIDFVQKMKEKQVRQVLLQKKDQVAVFTCTDKRGEFPKTLTICNKIIKTFEWSPSETSDKIAR